MHEGSYFTYIMASRSHTLYIGVTGNLEKRVFQHKWRECGGFTERYNCDRLVWFEGHQDVTRAIAREKQLNGRHPTDEDLSAGAPGVGGGRRRSR